MFISYATLLYTSINFLFVVVLKNIRNFRFIFVISITLITILIGTTAIAMPNAAYSLSSPPTAPNGDTISTVNNNDKEVILNFDDGYKSQYTNAKPILDKYGYKATFYIICNYVENGEEVVRPNARMSWENIIAYTKMDMI
jgi:peptidoglycan/xylan/chitin deacetylase (PgdA/CDA1 family)